MPHEDEVTITPYRDGRVDRSDLGVHLVRHGAVGRMALPARAQLDQLHRLTGVEVEHVADAVAEAQRVHRETRVVARRDQPLVGLARELECAAVVVAGARRDDLFRHTGAEVGGQLLPLHGQHPVALEVAEGAVVGDDLEAVAQRLEPATGAMTRGSRLA